MIKMQILEVIKNIIIDVINIEDEQITLDKSLKDIGANSIDRVEIISSAMEQFNLKFPLMTFKNVKNIGELVDVFSEKIAEFSA